MLQVIIIEDNQRLQAAMCAGLQATGEVTVIATVETGEDAVTHYLDAMRPPDVALMDVALAGQMNGIEAAVAIRREFPRAPIVFYSIQDDDDYYRAFLDSGILTHYAYVKKSNYLLPEMVLPLLQDAARGGSFIDVDIAIRVKEVRQRDAYAPLDLLEPNEQAVARMLADGMTNEQIAACLGLRDKRTISRVNGQIYASWGLAQTTTDEKVARTRAAIIMLHNRLIRWDETGTALVINAEGNWTPMQPDTPS